MAKKEVKKTTTELVMDMKGVVDIALAEATRLDEKGIKSSAGRTRKLMQEVKALAKAVRETALEKVKELKG